MKEFVDGFNAWLEANGYKLGGATLKDGAVTLIKEKVAVAPEKKEVKGGLLPHVPTWEKAGAVGLLAVGVAFGVGFMNAGDETKTVSAAPGNQAASAGAPNLYKAVTTVRVTPPGRPPADAAATSGNRVETVLPLFVKSPHRVELVNVQGRPVDSFVLPVPNEEGTVKGSTERGGAFDCFVNHRQGVNGSPSSGRCAVQPPSSSAVPATNAAANTEQVARTTETKEGRPWSLLAIPGVLMGAAGGLVLDEERRRRKIAWIDAQIRNLDDAIRSLELYAESDAARAEFARLKAKREAWKKRLEKLTETSVVQPELRYRKSPSSTTRRRSLRMR